MNKFAKVSIGIAVVAVVFMAGWGASDILMVERLLITGVNDEIRVSIGTDSMGGGFIIVKDFQGREVFSVRGNKVTQLEGGGKSGNQSTGPPSPAAGRVMRVEGVETRTGDVEALKEAAQLRKEAKQLEAKAQEKDDAVDENMRQRVPSFTDRYGRPLNDWKDRRRKWISEQKRERATLRKAAFEYRSEATKKTGQAMRLEREAKEVRQVIRGWDGRSTVILETVRDLSRKLRDLTRESCLKWTGRISRSDEDSETWSVTMVELVDCPPGLNNATRPDRKP